MTTPSASSAPTPALCVNCAADGRCMKRQALCSFTGAAASAVPDALRDAAALGLAALATCNNGPSSSEFFIDKERAVFARNALRAALAAPQAVPQPTKADRVHAVVNAGPLPGMSEAFDAHMGAACWTEQQCSR